MQDKIGWANFMLGRFPTRVRQYMHAHFQQIDTLRSATSWTRGLVIRLLQVTHDQWLARNEFVHDRVEEGLTREAAQTLQDNIEAQYLEGGDSLLPEDSYLFNPTLAQLQESSVADRRQWLIEIEAAREIAENAQRLAEDARPESNTSPVSSVPPPPKRSRLTSTNQHLGRRPRDSDSPTRRTKARHSS